MSTKYILLDYDLCLSPLFKIALNVWPQIILIAGEIQLQSTH